jgi:16S rRNA (cytosine1402-N4)-methyltransferase
MGSDAGHVSVLLDETLELLAVTPGGLWVDGTVGLGGHAAALLRASAPGGRLLGLDRDTETLERARAALAGFGDRARLEAGDYREIPERLGEERANGILLDLGLSSAQLDDPERGFSFQADGPLDMRMDRRGGETAADVVNHWPEAELADLLYAYGEERRSRRIARAIARARERGPIRTTGELAEIVVRALGPTPRGSRRGIHPATPRGSRRGIHPATPRGSRRGIHPATPRGSRRGIHPATRTFQALRIQVNHELEGLGEALEGMAGSLAPAGRLAVIAFHSLEDRTVKSTFRDLARRGHRVLTKKPVRPSEAETRTNPRARSARLRVLAARSEEAA